VKISIAARHCEVAPGVRQFTEQRLEKLQKFAPDIHGAHVVFSQEKARCQAEITLRLNGHELVSTQSHAEAGAAIQLALDRLEEQLRRYKDRRITQTHRKPRATNGVKSEEGDDAPEPRE
jgi:putative sigma-54 modulation protein